MKSAFSLHASQLSPYFSAIRLSSEILIVESGELAFLTVCGRSRAASSADMPGTSNPFFAASGCCDWCSSVFDLAVSGLPFPNNSQGHDKEMRRKRKRRGREITDQSQFLWRDESHRSEHLCSSCLHKFYQRVCQKTAALKPNSTPMLFRMPKKKNKTKKRGKQSSANLGRWIFCSSYVIAEATMSSFGSFAPLFDLRFNNIWGHLEEKRKRRKESKAIIKRKRKDKARNTLVAPSTKLINTSWHTSHSPGCNFASTEKRVMRTQSTGERIVQAKDWKERRSAEWRRKEEDNTKTKDIPSNKSDFRAARSMVQFRKNNIQKKDFLWNRELMSVTTQ